MTYSLCGLKIFAIRHTRDCKIRKVHVQSFHFLYFNCCNLVSLHRISTLVRLGVIPVILSLHGLSLYTCMLFLFCSVGSYGFCPEKGPKGRV